MIVIFRSSLSCSSVGGINMNLWNDSLCSFRKLSVVPSDMWWLWMVFEVAKPSVRSVTDAGLHEARSRSQPEFRGQLSGESSPTPTQPPPRSLHLILIVPFQSWTTSHRKQRDCKAELYKALQFVQHLVFGHKELCRWLEKRKTCLASWATTSRTGEKVGWRTQECHTADPWWHITSHHHIM